MPVVLYEHVALGSLLLGLAFMAAFFIYEMANSNATRSIAKELPLAAASSVFLASGVLFTALWSGLYV